MYAILMLDYHVTNDVTCRLQGGQEWSFYVILLKINRVVIFYIFIVETIPAMLVMSLSAAGVSPGVDISKFTRLVSRAGPQDYASVPSLQYSQKVLGSNTHGVQFKFREW
jgi:hypothetical protein